jgi:hypothetical protein
MGRSVPCVVCCLGSFYAVGRSVPWDVICCGSLQAWAILSLGCYELGPFCDWAVLSLGRFMMGRFVCALLFQLSP